MLYIVGTCIKSPRIKMYVHKNVPKVLQLIQNIVVLYNNTGILNV